MKRLLTAVLLMILAESGCASPPATRSDYQSLPPLDGGRSRLYFSAGVIGRVKLWSVHQVGPVYVNNQLVGSTAKDEHFVVDVIPGTYEVYCTPQEPDKNFAEKRQFTFVAGEARYLACDMEHTGGMDFGVIGALAAKYYTKSYLTEKPIDANSRLVAYKKLE